MASRTEDALVAAANVLNATGLTNASLDLVAAELGLSKSTLYYYFESKEDLVYKSYKRTCGLAASYALAASKLPGSGRQKFVEYLRLHFGAPPVAFLSDIALLTPRHQKEIRALAHEHDDLLRGILATGHADGSLFVERPQITNFAIIGSLNWVFVWFRNRPGCLTRPEIGKAFTEIFLHGLKPDGSATTDWLPPILIDDAAIGSDAAFDRTSLKKHKEDALYRTASIFFNHNGYDNATIDEIVAALKLTKGALYHYVASKEELLYGCYKRSTELTQKIIEGITRAGGSVLDMEARFISSMIALNASPRGPLAGYYRLESLSAEHQHEIRAKTRAHTRTFLRGNHTYVDNSVRKLDGITVRRAIVGSLQWLPRWYSPLGSNTPTEVSDSFCSLFINGLVPRE